MAPYHLSLPILKHLLGLPVAFSDLEFTDPELYRNLQWLRSVRRRASRLQDWHRSLQLQRDNRLCSESGCVHGGGGILRNLVSRLPKNPSFFFFNIFVLR